MKTIKIIVDGKEIEAQVNEDDLTQIGKEKSNRQDEGNPYYYIDAWMTAELDCDKNDDYTEQLYDCGNYFLTEKDCADAARAVSLWLRMKRFADEHNKNNLGNHIICFDRYDKKLRAFRMMMGFDKLFQVYFDSEETARQAIEEFKDDLMWYFTEFGKEL